MAIQILHRIGTYQFINLLPVPPRRKRRTTTETILGSDGYSIWFEAERGQVWQPRSIVDIGTHPLAQALKANYEDMASTIQPITYADLSYPNAFVQDVDVEIVDQVSGIGGFAVNPRALVIARWTILIE